MNVYKLYKIGRYLFYKLKQPVDKIRTVIVFFGNNVSYKKFKTNGVPLVSVAIGGICSIGENFVMNNGAIGNPIGCFEPCTIFVDKGAKLAIGGNVGMSQAAIICHHSVTIGNYVKLGGGVKIYDTDFHSLDPIKRMNPSLDIEDKKKGAVVLKDNVFVGAHSTILKGVTIGKNSVVGASSVVTKSIPDNEIWAGNPARFIKLIAN